MKTLARGFWAVFAVILFCFALLAVNQAPVALRFLAWNTPPVSVFWWLLMAFALGALLSGLGFGVLSVRQRVRQRGLNKQLDQSRKELQQLRSQPLQD